MGKVIIIKGADFSNNGIFTEISSSQSAIGNNQFYNASGTLTTYRGINGVSPISIPDGIKKIIVNKSNANIAPGAINCFDANMNQIQVLGPGSIGSSVALDSLDWIEIPDGTKYISYVYKSTLGSYDMGLALSWVGIH